MRKYLKSINRKTLFLTLLTSAFILTTSVAFAALTLSSTTVSSDGALTLTGNANSTLDLGIGNTLSLQTTNNGPITTGSGLFTLGGGLTIGGLTSGGTQCLRVSSTGVVSGTGSDCASGSTITATFLLCAGPCTVNETSNWKWSAPADATVTSCVIDAQTYPTGAAITVDVLKGGTTSIFSSTVPTLSAGSSAYNEQTGMSAAATLSKGDFLTAKVLTIGSSVAGQYVNVICKVTI